MEKTVYIIEDEEDIAKLIIYNLSLEGFKVGHFETGEEGLSAIKNKLPDLILLDLMLPGMSGFDICNKIKSNPTTKNIPIIMVSAKGEEEDIVKGLELGAEDYITKPFSPKVLIARVKTSLRRLGNKAIGANDVIKIRDLVIHTGKHAVTIAGEKVDLTPSEFQILHLLSSKTGWVFTRSQIVDAIRGDDYAVTDRTVDFQMVGLRKKMGSMGDDIETVRGIGYRFRE